MTGVTRLEAASSLCDCQVDLNISGDREAIDGIRQGHPVYYAGIPRGVDQLSTLTTECLLSIFEVYQQ